jgi:Cu(I)/Ag(I) efflux system membrane fusion protein
VIPATAPLITGKRAVVYVEKADADRPTYEGREIELGPRAGEIYVVRAGLAEGERVVVEGNFKIDSALQIRAKPSMMLPDGAETEPVGTSEEPLDEITARRLRPLVEAYLELQRSLAADDTSRAAAAFERVEVALGEAGAMSGRPELHAAAVAGRNAADLAAQRVAFRDLSVPVIALARRGQTAVPDDLVVAYCPMAFEGGASWLQQGEGIRNPFHGAAMLECGEVREKLTAPGGAER